nr:hypothetical protein MarFTME_228 [Marseillevirus futianmevirus]
MSDCREVERGEGDIETILSALKQKFCLGDDDVSVYVTEEPQNSGNKPIAVYQIFSGDDELVCSWSAFLKNGRKVHVWTEMEGELSMKQLTRKVLQRAGDVYYCPDKLIFSTEPHALARRIAALETPHDKIAIITGIAALGVGIGTLMTTF